MAVLGLDFLTFSDGLEQAQEQADRERRHGELIDKLVRAALVASGDYEGKQLFAEHFLPQDEVQGGLRPPDDDSEVDLDYSEVSFSTPAEDEMEQLAAMLADTSVTVSGATFEGPDAQQVDGPQQTLPPPREVALEDLDQDREWT